MPVVADRGGVQVRVVSVVPLTFLLDHGGVVVYDPWTFHW
jgi:hypothetical protein